MNTIGEAVSRARTLIKSVKQDANLTDRFLYSLIMKHGKLLMRRQDNLNRIKKFNSIFKPLHFVELEEIDRAELSCMGITSCCKIYRTKDKLPKMIEGYWGVLIRTITSLDQSQQVYHTYPTTYEQMTTQTYFKYNTKKYFWYLDGHLYFPNLVWNAVRLDAVFESSTDVDKYNCATNEDACVRMQDLGISIPDFLFSEIDELVKRDLTVMLQIPPDTKHDQQNVIS